MSERQRPGVGRRSFLREAGAWSAAALSGFASIERALALPARRVTGTLRDVAHVVILMQENRSFDHYFGTLSGVRGFADNTAIPLPSGQPVWHQSDGTRELLPFHLDTQTTNALRVPGTPHTWPDSQLAWDQGRFGFWAKHKQFQSMGYYRRADLPFQYALADAFTLCDAHHCSVQTGTLPNRTVFMTGTHVAPGRTEPGTSQAHALIDNANNHGKEFGAYAWTTYPERLEKAGVSWRIYQDEDNWGGLLAPWESFRQYREAAPGSPLFERALRRHSLGDLRRHVEANELPSVSWIIPAPVWSEHPSASSPLQGASYTQQVLEILLARPEVWQKTVFIVSFDENDGFFDHVPPPAVPSINPDGSFAGKTTLRTPLGGEYYVSELDGVVAARPYGMGPRVPLFVVSPWSRGGWVNSQVFDHTSTLQFLEARFGVAEPNITPWHRAVAGDLTSCLDFQRPSAFRSMDLPDMSRATAEPLLLDDRPAVSVPALQTLPAREPGVRLFRALPYLLHAHANVLRTRRELELQFENRGRAGAVFHVYDRLHLERFPRRYTLERGTRLSDRWDTRDDDGNYDLWIVGPAGFLRHYAGHIPRRSLGRIAERQRVPAPELRLRYLPSHGRIEFDAHNLGRMACTLEVFGTAPERSASRQIALAPGGRASQHWSVEERFNWFDVSVTAAASPGWLRRFAGRLENGRDGFSDPAPPSSGG